MRNALALVSLILAAVAIAGCATGESAASDPVQSPGDPAEPSDTIPGRVSAALEAAGMEDLRTDAHSPWNPDFSGVWRDAPAFAWIVDPESAGQVTEVHGSAGLTGAHGEVAAVVHGPELTLVRIPCQDLVVDVAAGVDVEQGTSDDGAAIELARALYPALGC